MMSQAILVELAPGKAVGLGPGCDHSSGQEPRLRCSGPGAGDLAGGFSPGPARPAGIGLAVLGFGTQGLGARLLGALHVDGALEA